MTGVPEPLLADLPESDDVALVRVEATVPGDARDVWWAVGTGAGIGTWFVPARVEPRVGGAVVTDHGPFGHSRGTVLVHDPPRRLLYEERDWAPDAPPWRTELLVEPGADGGCLVRLTSGLPADGARWRPQVEATREGWAGGLRNLVLARTHFPGQEAGSLFVVRAVRLPLGEAWTALLRALGLGGAAVGDPVAGAAGAPVLAGVVEEVGAGSLLLRTSAPAPGLVELSAHALTETSLVVRAHLFGPGGAVVAEAERPRWDAWLHARFPGARPT
jgi:uncharacterized protein YndB with AHSA1/START domain